jgi:sialate O-acetylesterase
MKNPFGIGLCLSMLLLGTGRALAAEPAKPFLHPLFTDHMVLQRDVKDPVWGWTQPGQEVKVSIDGKTVATTADADGKWLARVGPLPVGGPYTLTVSGSHQVTLTDVLAGDVWICSGQSNMEMGIGNVNHAQEEIKNANFPQIRLFSVPKNIATNPEPLFKGDTHWLVCTPETVAAGGWNGFTAAGYFFGRQLHQDLKIPIGLIHTSWGGTICEAWTSGDALEKMADFKDAVAYVRAQAASGPETGSPDAQTARWYAKFDPGDGKWNATEFDDSAWKTMKLPVYFQNAGLPGFNGIVWFRRQIDVPEGWAGKDIVVHVGPVDDRDTTYFNGVKIGSRDIFNQPRDYKVPGNLVKAGKSILAVRVLDTGGMGGICGNSAEMRVELSSDSHQSFSIAGDWLYKDSMALGKIPAPVPSPGGDGNNPNVSTVLYNGMIAPLVPFAIKGATWYQGESNANRAMQYRTLLPTMIDDWRNRFELGEFPFLIVQLANFTATSAEPQDSQWAELREAQSIAAEKVGHSAIASAIDIGDEKDIHPKNKQEVGRRLALDAEAIAYGQQIEYQGPTFEKMTVDGNKAVLQFTHAQSGLDIHGDTLKGFAIAGADGHFVWADAAIDGQNVILMSPKVAHPVAVRYAWANNPVANLYNKAGLPANPFRTDQPK